MKFDNLSALPASIILLELHTYYMQFLDDFYSSFEAEPTLPEDYSFVTQGYCKCSAKV